MQPPLLPAEALVRVLRLARTDGVGVLLLATFFALTSAAIGDYVGAIAWLLFAGAGALELHGAGLLREGEQRGLGWIVSSQFLFLLVVFVYVALRLSHYDPTAMREALTPDMKATLAENKYDQEDFLHTVYVTTYASMAGLALLYKGLMLIYFRRRRAAIAAALDEVSESITF